MTDPSFPFHFTLYIDNEYLSLDLLGLLSRLSSFLTYVTVKRSSDWESEVPGCCPAQPMICFESSHKLFYCFGFGWIIFTIPSSIDIHASIQPTDISWVSITCLTMSWIVFSFCREKTVSKQMTWWVRTMSDAGKYSEEKWRCDVTWCGGCFPLSGWYKTWSPWAGDISVEKKQMKKSGQPWQDRGKVYFILSDNSQELLQIMGAGGTKLCKVFT